MKTIFVKLCVAIFAFAALCSCGISADSTQKDQPLQNVVDNLDSVDLYIVINRIIPKYMPPRESMDGYFLSLKDGILTCYLPFIGSAHGAFLNSNEIAIDVEDTPVDVKVTKNPPKRSSYAVLEFSAPSKYKSEVFVFTVEIYSNGNTRLSVESIQRDFINYAGKLEKRPERKK